MNLSDATGRTGGISLVEAAIAFTVFGTISVAASTTMMNGMEFRRDSLDGFRAVSAARDFLAEHSPLSVCREVLESDKPYAAELWKGAAEMGWLGTAIPEEYGGAGYGRLELAVVAEEVGRALAPIPFSSSVYVATEALLSAGSDEQKKRYLPKLASGEAIGTFAFVEKPGQNAVEGVQLLRFPPPLPGRQGLGANPPEGLGLDDRSVVGINDQCHRAVIHERNRHVRTENTLFNGDAGI